ncbi:MAG: transporter, partial [Desulfovibrionales bacterium]|nr:transporter [Desulfovibrionales bacterium]
SSNDGLGDLVLMGRYRLLAQKKGDPVNLALGAGLKMPTGDTHEMDNMKTGCFGAGFQCGSGSWDPKLELALNRVKDNWRVDFTAMYTLVTEGDHEYEFGDKFQYNLGSSLALNKYVDLQLEYNGVWQDNNRDHGVTVRSSGGHLGYVTPGVHFKFSRRPNVHFDVGVPILVYRDLNGEQLSEDYQFVCKLAVKF